MPKSFILKMLRQLTRCFSTKNKAISKSLPKSTDVVVVGGGVIGLSTAYHLTELGYNNVIVIERDDITSGTTWHTNGLVWRLRPSETDIQLLSQTHNLLSVKLSQDSGFVSNGGLFLAHNQKRMQEYQRLNGISKYYGIESHILNRNQVIELLQPLIDEKTTDLTGGLYSPSDGFVDPHMYCTALVKAANLQVFRKCLLNSINTNDCSGVMSKQRQINSIRVEYDGDIHEIKTNIIINCSGCWAPCVAKLAGIANLPQEAMEHSYVITDSIDGVAPDKTPNIRDHDLSIVFRVSGNTFCIGGYEPNPVLISHKVNQLEPFTLFDLNWNLFGINLENSAKLMPVIGRTGIKQTICGPEAFTPDHKPLLGEDVNVRGFYHASAFNSFGISLSGGIGQQMAKWVTAGAPDIDLCTYDIKRFNTDLITNRVWSEERCRESYARNYGIIYPIDEPICARDKTFKDELYSTLLRKGCVYRERHGIQCPDWFDLEPTQLTAEQYMDLDHTYDWEENSRLWKAIKYECKSCHENAVIFDLSSRAKFALKGDNALEVMDSLSPTDLKSMPNNSTIVTYFLNTRAGIEAEVMINKINEKEFYITCIDLAANHVLTKINNLITDRNVRNTQIVDLTKQLGILSINGPKSTEILENNLNLSLNDIKNRTHQEIQIDDIKLRLIRFSQVSDIGWELHLNNNEDLKAIYWRLISDKSISNAGHRSYEYLKNENHCLSGCLDLRTDDILVDAGLESHVCEHKLLINRFIGSEAMKSIEKEKHFVWIEVEKNQPIVCGFEPISYKSKVIGLVRKHFYSHKKQKILAFGLIFNKFLIDSHIPSTVEIEIFGNLYKAKVEKMSNKSINI